MSITKRMVQFSFKCFKIADIINIFPLTLDQKTDKFSYKASKVTALIHSTCFGIACIKGAQLVFALITKLIANDDSEAVTILTGLWGSLCLTSTFWSYELFHSGLSETILLFNSLHFTRSEHENPLGRITNTVGSNWKKTQVVVHAAKVMLKWNTSFSLRQLAQKILSMGPQELLLVACPYAVSTFVPIYLGIMALFPHWSVFATSLVSPGTWMFWLAVGMEFIVTVFMQMNMAFLLFFELALQVVQIGGMDSLVQNRGLISFKAERHSVEHLDKCINLFDYYHMIVKLCNVLFSRILFTGKLVSLTCSIFGTYYVMTHIHSASPILLIFFTVLSIQGIGFYVISCKRLQHVPGAMSKMKDLCGSLLKQEKGKLTPLDMKVRQYKIETMPSLGISDGGFRYMDSLSTLIFIDFYLNQVISLLLV